MKIKMEVTLYNNEYRYILSVLYADRKRLTDLRDHAVAHGDSTIADVTGLDKIIEGLQYGELLEGSRE